MCPAKGFRLSPFGTLTKEIADLLYVPYTGATGDVDLGSKNLSTTGLITNHNIHTFEVKGNFKDFYSNNHQLLVADMLHSLATEFATGITITSIYGQCYNNATPTTQITATLKYCDGGGIVPGASPTTIETITTTTGSLALTGLTDVVPAGKIIYIDFGADPTDANTMWIFNINYHAT